MSAPPMLMGLPVGRLLLTACAIGGACAGLAGAIEVAAVHGRANASLVAGYGYAGILVAFLARHNPLAIIPVAILLGGIDASGGLIQRRMGLPDATVHGPAGHHLRDDPAVARRFTAASGFFRAEESALMEADRARLAGACRWPSWRAPSASARRSCSSASANA